jgi:Ser-tRNA(Ala) deacylase AlaX
MFGCERSRNAHIERKKSKISWPLPQCPTEELVQEIEQRMNEVIQQELPVTYEYATRDNLPPEVDTTKLPDDASATLRLVRIGDYDVCACIGAHVANTSEIGTFTLLGTNWDEEKKSFRIRFKLS